MGRLISAEEQEQNFLIYCMVNTLTHTHRATATFRIHSSSCCIRTEILKVFADISADSGNSEEREDGWDGNVTVYMTLL